MKAGKFHAENFLASLLWLTVAGSAAASPEFKGTLGPGEELVTLSTRSGVTVKILFLTPDAVPKGVFLFFPGGEGFLVNPEGRPKALYTRRFPGHGFVTALVDVASDRPYGMTGTDPFRASKEHLEDAKRVVDFVGEKWSKPVFLIGHSAGATSVAHLATILKDNRIGGIVLTGALGEPVRSRVSLSNLPLQNITYPALFVHHKEDPCASFDAAYQQHRRLISSPKVQFIAVLGGDRTLEIPCSPLDPGRGKS